MSCGQPDPLYPSSIMFVQQGSFCSPQDMSSRLPVLGTVTKPLLGRARNDTVLPNMQVLPAEPVDLAQYESAAELEALGLDVLKSELQRRGLKCGGSLADRAGRLFLLKHTPLEALDKKHLAKPAKKPSA